MSDVVEQIRSLMAEGYPAAIVAEKIGISRQRVYLLANKHGIAKPSPYVHGEHKLTLPRIITGGVVTRSNTLIGGTISELLVAADLLARGWYVYLPVVRQRHYDIIASRDDSLITLEVRSGALRANGKVSYYQENKLNCDYFAIVLTGSPVQYEPELQVLPFKSRKRT